MGIGKYILIVVGFMSCSTPAMAASELCEKLRAFEQSEPEHAGEKSWFEFHWGFDHTPNTMWSWGCRPSNDKPAKATCAWLVNHTNQEFTMMLPQAIMACYGYRFPKYASYDWIGMVGTIKLKGDSERGLVLDLDYRNLPNGEEAIRVSHDETDPLPPIQPMPKTEENGSGTGR